MFHRLIKSREGILVMAVSGLISVLKLGDRTIKASARQISKADNHSERSIPHTKGMSRACRQNPKGSQCQLTPTS